MDVLNEKNITVAKTIAKFVVGHSVSGVIVTLIHNNTTVFTKSQKVRLYIGAYAVGAMVADKAEDWTDKRIDEIVELVMKIKSKINPEETTPVTVVVSE